MNQQDRCPSPQGVSSIAKGSEAQMPGQDATKSAPGCASVARDPVDNVACRIGDASCATQHAGVLSRAKQLDSSGARRSLLRLQMRYGNQYVGQVLNRVASVSEPEGNMAAIERSIDIARGSGHGMDHGTRARMESAFGADFSSVRIHTDAHADSLNRSLSARAFTTGRDVFFRQGEYSPGTSSGRELLAHELTHVVQQNGDGIRRKMTVSQPDDPHEQEADEMAREVIRQEHAPATGRDAISRDKEEKRAATKAARDALLRQPEAPRSTDDEDKKKLHAKLAPSLLSRDKTCHGDDS